MEGLLVQYRAVLRGISRGFRKPLLKLSVSNKAQASVLLLLTNTVSERIHQSTIYIIAVMIYGDIASLPKQLPKTYYGYKRSRYSNRTISEILS